MPDGVLIVDDDQRFRTLARGLLTRARLDVSGEASDGASALAACAALRPTAVLLDIGLPDLDGFAVARRLAVAPDAPRVLLVSADPDPVPARAVTACGAIGFVHKTALASCDLRAYLAG